MDGGRNIKLNIAGKSYALKAGSQESERLMRLAAEDINGELSKYHDRYASEGLFDKLAMVALDETYSKLLVKSRMSSLTEEMERLHGELDSYLSAIDKK